MINIKRSNFQPHPFHLVLPSPWPIFSSLCLLNLTIVAALFMHNFLNIIFLLLSCFVFLFITMGFWFKDIITESTYLGSHTLAVQKGLNMGVALFIVTEALFFVAIFWTYFHSALSPTVELGSVWPPSGVEVIDPFEFPLFNTLILLSSGISVTYAHHSLIQSNRKSYLNGLLCTVLLGLIFTALQATEYLVSSFTMSDGAFGSCFYFGTGFHGIHVIIGTIFLIVGLWRGLLYHYTENHHLGLESAILYWHFVDIVWLILFIGVYYWGS